MNQPSGAVVACTTEQAPELLELCTAALPDETLALDDLEGLVVAHDDGSVDHLVRQVDAATLGLRAADGALQGAAAVSLTSTVGHLSAHLQLLVVHPLHRRRGVARALVGASQDWARARGSASLTVGAGAPFYVFTGVDSRWTDALCCFEALGYERVGAELDLTCPTQPPRVRSEPLDADLRLSHVGSDVDAAALASMVQREFPHWSAEFARAADAGTVVVARRGGDGQVVGAAAHSVSRFGVVGPVAVSTSGQRRGTGTRLMAAVLADLSTAGLRSAEIAWTSTVRFYARSCAARVGRTSLVLRRELDG